MSSGQVGRVAPATAITVVFLSTIFSAALAGCHKADAPTPAATNKPANTAQQTAQAVTSLMSDAITDGRSGAGIAFAAVTPPTSLRGSTVSLHDLPPLPRLDLRKPVPATQKSPAGLLVCEPVPALGLDEPSAAFAAGCGDWLLLAVGGQPAMGQMPLLTSVNRARRENKFPDLRLMWAQARRLAAASGAPQVAVGTATAESSGSLKLTWQVYDIQTGKPRGAPFVARGTRVQIMSALPALTAEMSRRVGIVTPKIATKADDSEAELQAAGRILWHGGGADTDIKTINDAAARSAFAGMVALASNRGEAAPVREITRTLLTHTAPENSLVWGLVGFIDSSALLPYQSQLKALRSSYPQNYAFAHAQVWAERAGGTPRGERTAAEAVVRNAPGNADAWLCLGYTLSSEANNLRRARFAAKISEQEWVFLNHAYPLWEACTKRATELDPQHEVAWERLSEAATFAGEGAVAEDAFAKAEVYTPDKSEVYDWGLEMFQPKWGGSKASLDKTAQHAADANYTSVEEAGSIVEALKVAHYLTEAERLDNRYQAKIAARLSANSNDPFAHWDQACLLWKRGEKRAACREYKEVVRLLPNNSRAHFDYAFALDELGAKSNAIPEYRTVLRKNPAHATAAIYLGRCLKHENSDAEAEKFLREGLARMPNSEEGHYGLGELYMKQKRWPAAATEFKRALDLEGFGPPVFANAVWAMSEAGRLDEAIKYGEEGVGMYGEQKDNPEMAAMVHSSLGNAYGKKKRYEEQLSEFRIAQQLLPGDLTAEENIADALNDMGKRGEARKIWAKVAAQGAEIPAAIEAREMLAKYPENGK